MYTIMVPHENIHISAGGPLHPYILLGLAAGRGGASLSYRQGLWTLTQSNRINKYKATLSKNRLMDKELVQTILENYNQII
jgi:hypothetical protein